MKLKTNISKVSTQSLGTLALRVIETVNASGIEEAKTSKNFLKLTELNDAYQQAIDPVNIKSMSNQIDNKFTERNQLFTELFTYVKGLTVADEADVKTAAQKIYDEISKFGLNFSKLRKSDKTLRYIRIIESLKQSEFADALQKTKLTDKLNALDIVQRAYEDLYMGRGNRVAGKVAATSIRYDMETVLKKYLDEVALVTENKETEDWKTLYTNLKKRVEEVSASVRNRQVLPKPPVNNTETSTAS
ncbi:hypothetical protein TRIP_D300220 [uncultured Paludibacter sp.]|nr:hypothetical protein TRIP_D300220 [uncultured Paludibacter sp.]